MKIQLIPILISTLFFSTVYGQKSFTTEKDVLEAKKIFFYGYDFTDFQLIDVKRLDEDIKKFVFTWTAFCQEQADEKHLKKWLSKDTILFNFQPTVTLNKKLNSENLGGIIKHEISKDSLQTFVNRYNLAEKEGIGLVSIVECFDNANKRSSAYYVFFDIATKKIITVDYIILRDGNSYNRVADWGVALLGTVKKFRKAYIARLESLSATNPEGNTNSK